MTLLISVVIALSVMFGVGKYQSISEQNTELSTQVNEQEQEIQQLKEHKKDVPVVQSIDGVLVQNLSEKSL